MMGFYGNKLNIIQNILHTFQDQLDSELSRSTKYIYRWLQKRWWVFMLTSVWEFGPKQVRSDLSWRNSRLHYARLCEQLFINAFTMAEKFHIQNFFLNLVRWTRNEIVFTIFQLIWIQTEICLNPNHSGNGKYNLISGWFNKIQKRFLCVWPPVLVE